MSKLNAGPKRVDLHCREKPGNDLLLGFFFLRANPKYRGKSESRGIGLVNGRVCFSCFFQPLRDLSGICIPDCRCSLTITLD